jgi:cellobiose phosphorylase
MFSHMAMMFAYALYERRKTIYAHKITKGIYKHCMNFDISKIYPGIPEYINQRGRGMYTYLTGSASWYLLTLITKIFGVRGLSGDLILDPQLVKAQFDEKGIAKIITLFGNRKLEILYHNPAKLESSEYQIHSITINSKELAFQRLDFGILIRKQNLKQNELNKITVLLGEKN